MVAETLDAAGQNYESLSEARTGRLADRIGNTSALQLGVALFLAACVGFALATASLAVLLSAFVLAGAGIGCCETAEQAAVATLAPEEIRGSAFGLLAAAQSVGNLARATARGVPTPTRLHR